MTATIATTGHAEPAAHAPGSHATSTGISNIKLAIWAFLGSECLFFGAFISTYLLYRGRDTAGPKPKQLFDVPFTSCTSFILLMSSLTMVLALAAIQRGDHRRFTNFYREGLNLHVNLFGSTFFILTGLHGAHVTVGIFWLLSLYSRSLQGKLTTEHAEAVEVAGLYWHFVDIVWIFIFTAIYLVPYH
jgi:heme/copper-type cytochrome/quinol oxidase subunit 3